MYRSWIFVSYFLVQQVFAQDANITASTCVNSNEFTTCYQSAAQIYNKCDTDAGTDATKWMACSCDLLKGELACATSNCWNVAYGCEYQYVANLVTAFCDGKDIPYFPAPENAPGGCSCNLGYVTNNMTAVITSYETCSEKADSDKQAGCDCCLQSGIDTSKYSVCPNTNPSLVGYVKDAWILQYLPSLDQCGSSLAKYDCVKDLGFPKIGTVSYLSSAPASTGTATLSTLSGTITTPPATGTSMPTAESSNSTTGSVTGGRSATSSASTFANSGTKQQYATRSSLLIGFGMIAVFLFY